MENTKDNYKILCACGCGEYTDRFNKWGYERIFVRGHQGRRSLNKRWRGGQFLKASGYRMILLPSHHFATKQGYVPEHRLVWEKHNHAILLPWADVHHRNGQKLDNRIENLDATTKSNHIKLHCIEYRNEVIMKRVCVRCSTDKTPLRRGYYQWFFLNHDKSKPICNKCYDWIRRHSANKVSHSITV